MKTNKFVIITMITLVSLLGCGGKKLNISSLKSGAVVPADGTITAPTNMGPKGSEGSTATNPDNSNLLIEKNAVSIVDSYFGVQGQVTDLGGLAAEVTLTNLRPTKSIFINSAVLNQTFKTDANGLFSTNYLILPNEMDGGEITVCISAVTFEKECLNVILRKNQIIQIPNLIQLNPVPQTKEQQRDWKISGVVQEKPAEGVSIALFRAVSEAKVTLKVSDKSEILLSQTDLDGNYSFSVKDSGTAALARICVEHIGFLGPQCSTISISAGNQTVNENFSLVPILSSCQIDGPETYAFGERREIGVTVSGPIEDFRYRVNYIVSKDGRELNRLNYDIADIAGNPIRKNWFFKQAGNYTLQLKLADIFTGKETSCFKELKVILPMSRITATGWYGLFPIDLEKISDLDSFTSSSEGRTDCSAFQFGCDSVIRVDLGNEIFGNAKIKFGYRQATKESAKWSVQVRSANGAVQKIWESGRVYRQFEEKLLELTIPVSGRYIEFIAHDIYRGSAALKVYEVEPSIY